MKDLNLKTLMPEQDMMPENEDKMVTRPQSQLKIRFAKKPDPVQLQQSEQEGVPRVSAVVDLLADSTPTVGGDLRLELEAAPAPATIEIAIATESNAPGSEGQPGGADWKDPVLFDRASLPEIKADILPSWLGAYAKAVSEFNQTPEGLAVMLGLSALATCVQKRFEICPYGDEYTEPLSLWTVTVLPSSERKTPVLRAMTAPISSWEKDQAAQLKSSIAETENKIQIEQKRIEKLRQEAVKESDSEVRQKILDEISQIQEFMPTEVRAPKLWIGDTTAESLQDLLAENEEKMAVISDEGNIFEIMGGLYTDGKLNIDIFLQAYSGSPARIKRKTREVSLERPALTFGLAVQPVVIESFAIGSKKQFKGKGALGRFLFCLPESKLGKRVIGQRKAIPTEVKTAYDAGVRGLLSAPRATDEDGNEMPRVLELDVEALDVWEDFSRRVEAMLGPKGALAAMGDWGGKLPGTALRIAGLLHLVEKGCDNYIVEKESIARAVLLCERLLHHARAAFSLIGTDEPESLAKRIFVWMKAINFEVFTRTKCNEQFKGTIKKEQLDDAFEELERRNIVKSLLVPTGGKSATNYISNPALKPTAR